MSRVVKAEVSTKDLGFESSKRTVRVGEMLQGWKYRMWGKGFVIGFVS
jgi:hypothetical protein